ncbi:GumC family protein [candidate division KSB1 bacterium]
MQKQETTILDYIYTLLKWKRFIILFTLMVSLITAGVTLIVQKWYSATAVVMAPTGEAGLTVFAKLSTVGFNPLGSGILGGDEQLQQHLAILKSRTAGEYIAEKFDLKNRYGSLNWEETLIELREHSDFGFTDEGGLYITIEDTSAVTCSEMANAYVTILDSLNIDFKIEQAKNNRIFIEGRLNTSKIELADAEDSLESFQKEYDIISIPDQYQAAIESYASLQSEKILKEMELEAVSGSLSKLHPTRALLEKQIESLSEKLKVYEDISGVRSSKDDLNYFIPFAESPTIEKKYLRLKREVEMLNILYALLAEQLEQAKIQEAQTMPTLWVLENAVPPIKRSRPKRTITVVLFGSLAFIFSIFLVFTLEYIETVQRSSPEEQQKMQAIRSMLFRNPRKNE